MNKRVSVVIATYNRGALLQDLLLDLAKQDFDPNAFEVVVVDDGSKEPAAPHVHALKLPYQVTMETQANAGPAAARDKGVRLAQGDIIVITDDDMRVDANFLSQHVAAHDAGATLVLGHICAAPSLAQMPLFERFHAYQLDKFVEGVRNHTIEVLGVSVCTGNVSFRRADYLAVGGFDKSLGRSEDRELGVRLEKHGATLVFCEGAKVVHKSDHADLNVWLRRAFNYGVYDHRIAVKHPDVETADPWRFYFMINPISRTLMLVPLTAPGAGEHLARLVMRSAMVADKVGLKKLPLFATTLTYGLEYFRGLRVEAGSTWQAWRDFNTYLGKREAQKKHEKV